MKLLAKGDDQVDVRISLADLILIANMLNEVCHGFALEDDEFLNIFDAPRSEFLSLLRRVDTILRRLGVALEPDS